MDRKVFEERGKAYVLIPDGILARTGGKKLRNHILSECFLDAIISLPRRTFFANFKHTYILAITKKNDPKDNQTEPVFTYIVSNIGERLTSVKREEIDADDLSEMETAFKIFSGARATCKVLLEKAFPRCKIQDIAKFDSPHWVIDRWWSRIERIKIGIEETLGFVSKAEIDKVLAEFTVALKDYEKFRSQITLGKARTKEVEMGDKTLFDLSIGRRVLKKTLVKLHEGGIAVYSANVFDPMGYMNRNDVEGIAHNAILWGIDGNFGLRCAPKGEVLVKTDHCGAIQILDSAIVPEYLLYALTLRREEETFDRSFRASLSNMRRFTVKMPLQADGAFNIKIQQEIAGRFTDAEQKKAKLDQIKNQLDGLYQHYAGK